MDNRIHISLKAEDRSYFALLKKEIHTLAISAGFSVVKTGAIDIIVAELVSNIVKHGEGGDLLVKIIDKGGIAGIELIGIDHGPGIADISRVLSDGISTKNTLGNGMGAMKRLSDEFQVFSYKNAGTVILIRVYLKEPAPFQKIPFFDVKDITLAKKGEEACGDGFYKKLTPKNFQLFLGDGLGHGPDAEKAVEKAGEAFLACGETEPNSIIRFINTEVKKTRGLVGTAVVYSFADKKWKICGVGNISTKIIGPSGSKNYMAYNGIIGLNVPNTLNTQEIIHEKGQHLIMCSDGIKSRWELPKFPSVFRYDPAVIAATIIKDHARHTDDISVAVCRIN